MVEGLAHQDLITALQTAEQWNQQLQDQLHTQQRYNAFIDHIRALIIQDISIATLYRIIVESLAQTFNYDNISIYSVTDQQLILEYQVGYEYFFETIPLNQGIMGRVVRNRRPELVANVATDPDFITAVEGIAASIAIPLINKKDVVGILLVETHDPDRFSEADLNFLATVSEHVTIALTFINLYNTARESEDRYRRLVELSPEIIVVHQHGKLVYVNPAAIEFIGAQTPDQIIGRNVLEFVVPEDLPLVIERQKQIQQTGKLPLAEERFIRLDGSICDVEVMGIATNYNGEPAVQLVIHDITERKIQERERINYERTLLESQKMESLGVLAGGIAHDFNNLLMVILTNSDLTLLDLDPASEAYQSVRMIEDAARKASKLTNQMLAYSGRGHFLMKSVDCNELLQSMTPLLEAAIPKGVALLFELADDIPEIEADISQLRQIVLNLVTNAGEAIGNQEGHIIVKTSVEYFADHPPYFANAPRCQAGAYICLEVIDVGIGMTQTTLAKIFDPFFSTKFTGRGLGLSAVLGIMRSHHGTIDIQSRIDHGTTIRIFLPISPTPANQMPLTTKLTTTHNHILIVDDEPSVRSVSERVLARLGFEVLSCGDGVSAIELFKQYHEKIVCVLLDLTMPMMNGEQTLAGLQQIQPDVRAIMMSGYNAEHALNTNHNAGIVAFLQKPFTIYDLQAVITGVVDIPNPLDGC